MPHISHNSYTSDDQKRTNSLDNSKLAENEAEERVD